MADSGKKLRVLLTPFTWEPDVIEHQAILEEDVGYEVDLKNTWEIAQAEEPYDLIIQMGIGGDPERAQGVQYLRRLHERFPTTPILLISGHDPRVVLEEVKSAGANSFLRRDQSTQAMFVGSINQLLSAKPVA